MKKIVLAAAMAMAFAGAAKADWVDYWGFGGGGTQSPDLGYGGTEFEMDYGYNLGGVIGWNQSEEVSIAADVFFTESEYDGFSTNLSALSFNVDVFYVCQTDDFWRPYLGIGVGAYELRYDGGNAFPTFSGSDWAIGYQGMAGIAFDVDETHAITIGYRYQQSGDVTIQTVPDIEYASHSITIGVLFD